MSTLKPLTIDIVSDVVCPWCYIGKRRIENALALVPDVPVEVHWRPFFLNSWVPREGISRDEYLTAKFGSVEAYKGIAGRVVQAAGEEGLSYHPELVKRQMGVLAMKTMANGIILKSKTVSAIECLHYAMSMPTSVVITGIDSTKILDQAFEAVRTFQDIKKKDIDAILLKTKDAAKRGEFEPFKTSSIFDGTAENPDWIGKEPKRLQNLMPH